MRQTGIFNEQREGEVRLEIDPAGLEKDAGLVYIGHVETPWHERKDCPRNGLQSDAVCTLVVDEAYRQGLTALGDNSHIYALYWMDRSRRDLIIQSPKHTKSGKGCFALRTPVRPNPIALSVVELIDCDMETGRIRVRGLDCLDGTPLVDIKPYFASTDSRPEAAKVNG